MAQLARGGWVPGATVPAAWPGGWVCAATLIPPLQIGFEIRRAKRAGGHPRGCFQVFLLESVRYANQSSGVGWVPGGIMVDFDPYVGWVGNLEVTPPLKC